MEGERSERREVRRTDRGMRLARLLRLVHVALARGQWDRAVQLCDVITTQYETPLQLRYDALGYGVDLLA